MDKILIDVAKNLEDKKKNQTRNLRRIVFFFDKILKLTNHKVYSFSEVTKTKWVLLGRIQGMAN